MKGGNTMIEAVLHGKSLGYQYTEDFLTSTIFGLLKYLPLNCGIIPFIEGAILYDDQKTPLWKKLKSEGIELSCYQNVKYIFWNKHIRYGEPDLLLLFTNHIHGEDDFLLVIEAKFKSDKSGTGDYDQLMRYYSAVKGEIEGFKDSQVANFKGKRGYVIYLTEAAAADEIEESIKSIRKNDISFDNSIFHLRWHQLYKMLLDRINIYSNTERMIAEDLIKYLERMGLKEFTGISAPEQVITGSINKNNPIFFSIIKEDTNKLYFNDLPLVKISNQEFCFYRGK